MSGKGKTDSVENLLNSIERTFGIPKKTFQKFLIYERKKGEFWITTPQAYEFEFPVPTRYGFKFAQTYRDKFRLSTAAIQTFGHLATSNFVELEKREMEKFIRGENLHNRWDNIKGQVIVRYRGFPLGSAVLTQNTLKNQIPRARKIKTPLKEIES